MSGPWHFARIRATSIALLAVCGLSIVSYAQHSKFSDPKVREERRKLHQQKFLLEHSDPSGRFRPDLWRKGIAATKGMKIVAGVPRTPLAGPTGRRAEGAALLGSSSVTGVEWTQIGPAPLVIDAEQNFQGTGPDSGEVLDIAIDPRNSTDKIIFVASNDGGVWKSTDGGTTWAAKTDFLPSLSMGAIALDPNNPSIVYAGTGNPHDGGGVFSKGVGIYKSVDDGETWTILNPSDFVNAPNGVFSGVNINRIVVLTNGVVLVGTSKGLFKSIDGGQHFGSAPLFNDDTPVLGNFISDLKIDTATATTVFAAASGVGVFQSTDSGSTFTNLFTNTNGAPTSNFGYITIAQTTQPDNNTMYTSVQDTTVYPNPPPNGAPFKGVYKTTNLNAVGGPAWTQIPAANAGNGCQCGYDQAIAVDPQNANLVYLGFQDFWVSTDGANTFGIAGDNDVHDDIHAFTFSPASHTTGTPTTIYVGSDGGMAKTTNSGGGGSWSSLNGASGTAGIATNLLVSVDIGRNSTANNVYTFGGMQDTGIAQHSPGDAGTDWHLHQDGDGGRTVADPSNPLNVYSQDDGIFDVSTNAGSSWNLLSSAGSGLPDCGGNFKGSACAFPVAVDPNNSKIVYAASGSQLFQSTDQGNTFTSIKNFSPKNINVGTMVPIDSNTMWVGLSDGSIQFSNNLSQGTTATWNTTTSTGSVNGGVSGIVIDPTNTTTAAVTYARFCGPFICPGGTPTQHVYLTSDNGGTWTDVSGTNGGTQNLPDLPLHSVVIDPGTSPHTLIVSSDAAVLRSADLGNTWQVLGVGLPTVFSTELALDSTASPSLLRIGTYGRSAFELTAASGPLLAINANLAFATVCEGGSATLIAQLFNVGSTDLVVSSFNLVPGSSTDFSIVSGPTTPVTILPGEEIDWTIQFQPSPGEAGFIETATFQINSTDSVQPARFLSASGIVGAGSINPFLADSGNFGNVCVGSFADLPLTLDNAGSCGLSVNSMTTSTADFLIPGFTPPLLIAAGNSSSVAVRFQPTSFGAKSDSVSVSSNDPFNPVVNVPVSGNAPPPEIKITGTGDFGNQCAGSNATQSIQVCDFPPVGACSLSVLNAALNAGCTDFTLVNNPFPATVSSNSCLALTVKFTPTSVGSKSCTVTVSSNDPANSSVTIPLTGTTPTPSLSIIPDIGFPPTVVQTTGACVTPKPQPITNSGLCNVNINSLTYSGTNASDYYSSGLPVLPTPLQPGHQLGEGNLDAVFAPLAMGRNRDALFNVVYESDPITHATTTVSRNVCGEGVTTGARLLVTAGGVPVQVVKKIHLTRLTTGKTVDSVLNAPLQSFTPSIAACGPFQFHREWGTVSNPIQLRTGSYRLTVTIVLNGKTVSKTVSFDTSTCTFNPNIVVNF